MAEELVDKLEQAWRQNAESAGVETQQIEGELALIRKMMRVDAEFFIEFFLAESLDMSVPEFHKEIWGLLTDQDKERILLAIPRDHAKTTLAKLVVIWYWLHTSHRFCVYLSNTAPIAKGACRDIIEFLSHPNFISVYGPVKIIKQSENEGLWVFDLTMPSGKRKRCMLRGLGQGQQMRGINIDNQRPDIAVVDDVEDNDNTESETQQRKLDRWMFGPFIKALARKKKKIIWLGNMLSKTSLLARLSRSPRWNPVVYGSLVKDTESGQLVPLWPQKWTVAALQEDFAEYRDNGLVETWMCEMMNMPGHGENGFTADQLFYQPMPTPDSITCAWLSIDPAFGLNAHNDETAISVHVIPKHGVPMTVASAHGHFADVRIFDEAVRLAEYWGAWVWGVEAVAAQRVLISLFQLLAAARGYHNRIQYLPLKAGKGDPKLSRMRAFVSLMAHKEWALSESDIDITNQILSLDMRLKEQADDIVDSAAYGPAMMEQYLPFIQTIYNDGAAWESEQHTRQGMEVASV